MNSPPLLSFLSVFLRPLTTIARVVLDKYQYFGPFGAEGPNDYRAPQFYVTLIQNLSIFTAFAGLLKFYHAADKELAWCRPFAKFLCIKGVVFMTFWQGLAITVLAEVTDVGADNSTEWAMAAQNFLICLEMLLFSIAHFYCFPTDEWEDDYKANFTKGKFGETLAFGDFMEDFKLIMKANLTTEKKRKKITKKLSESEPIPEEDEDEEGGADDITKEEGEDHDEEEQAPRRESQRSAQESEDSESDDDESDRTSVTSSDEVQQARARIRKSAFLVLDAMSFSSPAAEVSQPESNSTTHDVECGDKEYIVESGGKEDIGDEQEASERTGLLSGTASQAVERTRNDEMLRPSIFTTIAEISNSSRSMTNSNEEEN